MSNDLEAADDNVPTFKVEAGPPSYTVQIETVARELSLDRFAMCKTFLNADEETVRGWEQGEELPEPTKDRVATLSTFVPFLASRMQRTEVLAWLTESNADFEGKTPLEMATEDFRRVTEVMIDSFEEAPTFHAVSEEV